MAFTLVAGTASAHGWFSGWRGASPEEIVERHNTMYQNKADLLGVSINTIKDAWAEGKSLLEIAEENGLTEEDLRARMLEAKKQRMQEHMQILVDNGVITQAQADQRQEVMNSRFENGGKRGYHRGFGMGFRF